MFTTNPFSILAETVPPIALQSFVIAMVALVIIGTLVDIIHKKNVKYFFENAKKAKAMTDNAKVAIRNVRKHANDKIKKLEKDKELTKDESKAAQDEIQKITDSFVAKADETFKTKEAEILKV